jgi:hypothetical protein
MWLGGKCDCDSIARANDAALDDDGHYASLAVERAIGRALEDGGHETGLKMIELDAGVTQAGDSYYCRLAQAKLRSCGELEKFNALGGDVLAEVAVGDCKPLRCELIEELAVQKVNLPQVRLGGVLRDARPVLHGDSSMCIAVDTEPRDENDVRGAAFREGMGGIAADGNDSGIHRW